MWSRKFYYIFDELSTEVIREICEDKRKMQHLEQSNRFCVPAPKAGTLPVAVPEISCSLFAREISTAATRSAPFIRHWRRSPRSPTGPHPDTEGIIHDEFGKSNQNLSGDRKIWELGAMAGLSWETIRLAMAQTGRNDWISADKRWTFWKK